MQENRFKSLSCSILSPPNPCVSGKQIHIYGLIKHCTAFRALYSPAAADWAAEIPALHRSLINDKAARSQAVGGGQPLIFWRPQAYVGRCVRVCSYERALICRCRDWMRHIHFESSFRRVLGSYVACLRFAPLQVMIWSQRPHHCPSPSPSPARSL